MSAIFISHSSADNDAAEEMKQWLELQGHTSLFLDFDPEKGIKGGSDWEQTIYRKLRQCQAVIALLTPNWLASKWCFAELVQARERGKAIFPVKVQPCEADGVFGDIQHIDLTVYRAEGYQRLRTGLLERGFDPLDVFDWDPKRPPYPGLVAFQEQDAAIFFGRSEEVIKNLEALDALRRQGNEAARFALLLGASGSGKSSLVRAGILPRLKKQPSEWLPIPPFRPQLNPSEELALALAAAFQTYGQPRDWHEIYNQLNAVEQGRTAGQTLVTLVRDLSMAARQPDATVLITLDQAEELFGYTPAEAATRFLHLLRAGLESGDRRLMAIATLRSDFLGEFQNHSVLHDSEYPNHFRYRAMPVDPMPIKSFPEIIRGPARLAGLRLDGGLVEAMVSDTGTRYALPLLAFTLRRLYERCGGHGHLTLDEYTSLGRLEGAIQGESERIIAEAEPTPDDLDALHAAFVPTLVRINAEGGYARRRALIDALPRRALPLLRRFVDARLLVTDRDTAGRETMEVAHEALLRNWPQLDVWLTEDQDKLRLLGSLQRSASEWDQDGRRGDLLIHHNTRLKDVETLVATPRFAVSEGSIEQAYLCACREAQETREAAEKEEQERRIRDAERIAEEQEKRAEEQVKASRKLKGLLGGLALTAVGLLILVLYTWHQSKIILSRQLVAQSFLNPSRNFYHPLLLSLAAQQIAHTFETQDSLLRAIERVPRQLSFLWGHEKFVTNVVFSPNGKILASAVGNAVILHDLATRKLLGEPLLGHQEEVSSVAFSPDGKTLASGSDDRTVILWDLATRKPLDSPLVGHKQPVTSIAFSPDGKILASGSVDRTVILWDLATRKPLDSPLVGHKQPVTSIAFSPDGKILASGSGDITGLGDDSSLILWDMATHMPLGTPFSEYEYNVTSVTFSPDGKTIASGTDDRTVILVDATTQKPLGRPLAGHKEVVTSVAFSPDGKTLASGSKDQRVILWDMATRKPLDSPLAGHQHFVTSIAFSPDGKTLASGDYDGTVIIWDLPLHIPLGRRLAGHKLGVTSVAFSPDGKTIASGSKDQRVILWDMATRTPLNAPLAEHEDPVTTIAFSPDGKTIVLGDIHGVAIVWDVAEHKLLGEPFAGHKGFGTKIAFSSEGKTLALGGDDGTLILWDVAGRKPLGETFAELNVIVDSIAFSPDSKTLALGGDNGTLILWDVAGRKPLGEPFAGHKGIVTSIAFSPDGKTLASGSDDGTLILWNVERRKPLSETLQGHQKEISSVAFSPDGKTLASGSEDQTVILWDVASRKSLGRPLVGHKQPVTSIAFSPDGKTLASGSEDQTVILWNIDVKSWEELACHIANRNLTPREWKEYVGDAMTYRPVCPDLPVPAE